MWRFFEGMQYGRRKIGEHFLYRRSSFVYKKRFLTRMLLDIIHSFFVPKAWVVVFLVRNLRASVSFYFRVLIFGFFFHCNWWFRWKQVFPCKAPNKNAIIVWLPVNQCCESECACISGDDICEYHEWAVIEFGHLSTDVDDCDILDFIIPSLLLAPMMPRLLLLLLQLTNFIFTSIVLCKISIFYWVWCSSFFLSFFRLN